MKKLETEKKKQRKGEEKEKREKVEQNVEKIKTSKNQEMADYKGFLVQLDLKDGGKVRGVVNLVIEKQIFLSDGEY